jgi:hypothetical protein
MYHQIHFRAHFIRLTILKQFLKKSQHLPTHVDGQGWTIGTVPDFTTVNTPCWEGAGTDFGLMAVSPARINYRGLA